MTQRLNYPNLSPDLIHQLSTMTQAIKKALDPALVDLVNIRASQLNGCAFCLDMHIKEAKIRGERELRLHHVQIWRESSLFSEKERAALELTEAVTQISNHGVSDELFDRVKAVFSDKEISDLTFAIGIINQWNRLAITFRSVPGSADTIFGLDRSGLR